MKKAIITIIFLIFFAASAEYAAIAPEIFNPLTPYTDLTINELSLIYIVSMVILSIIFIYLLARIIIKAILKYIDHNSKQP